MNWTPEVPESKCECTRVWALSALMRERSEVRGWTFPTLMRFPALMREPPELVVNMSSLFALMLQRPPVKVAVDVDVVVGQVVGCPHVFFARGAPGAETSGVEITNHVLSYGICAGRVLRKTAKR